MTPYRSNGQLEDVEARTTNASAMLGRLIATLGENGRLSAEEIEAILNDRDYTVVRTT